MRRTIAAFIILVGVIGIQGLSGLIILRACGNMEKGGQFGDMFGFANALFSGLAFAGVIFALYLQQKELAHQQEQIESQNKMIAQQSFESFFFQLLRLHNDILHSLNAWFPDFHKKLQTGRMAFQGALAYFKNKLREAAIQESDKAMLELVSLTFREVCLKPDRYFGHYFRNLYHVIKFVDSQVAPKLDKKRYIGIVCAQLTGSELFLLFFNCLSYADDTEFKELVERYALLENLPHDPELEKFRSLYKPGAFGN